MKKKFTSKADTLAELEGLLKYACIQAKTVPLEYACIHAKF